MIDESAYVGQPIRSLQRMLRTISAYDDTIPQVAPDGFYGEQTANAVRAVQKQVNLPVNGIVDLPTWEAIVRLHNTARIQVGQAQPLEILLQNSVDPNTENRHLLMMKSMLMALRDTYPEIPVQTVASPKSDAPFRAAIRWLQKAGGLPQSGCLDKESWRLLARLYRATICNG